MDNRNFRFFSLLVVLSLLLTAFISPAVGATPDQPEQPVLPATSIPAPLATFEGLQRINADPTFAIGAAGSGAAETRYPDTSGDVGRTRYIQTANRAAAIYSKTGTLIAQSTMDAFWATAGTGTACDGSVVTGVSNHHGQATVIYDHMGQRWMIADVAYTNVDDGPYYICMAVTNSVAQDSPNTFSGSLPPALTGDWWFYTLRVQEGQQYLYRPDFVRVALWPDGFYIAANLEDVYNNGQAIVPKGAKVWAVNRSDLEIGIGAYGSKAFFLPEELGYSHLIPSTLQGDPPPFGTPNFFAALSSNSEIELWKFKVNWLMPDSSTFSPEPTLLPATPYSWATGFWVPQAGNPERLDIISHTLNSLVYREINGVGALWANHTDVLDGGNDAMRWYEVRAPNGSPFINQSGVYLPDNTTFRWVSSLAVDGEGNMAIGYSASNPSMYPAIRYTGRAVSDPLGTLVAGESTLYAGTTYQDMWDNNSGTPVDLLDGPWGRRSSMSVDPVDDCVFWYTNEYYTSADYVSAPIGAHENWHTRIGYFRFPNCRIGTTKRVSLDSYNQQVAGPSGVDFDLYSTAISADGRFVAFSSEANNLVAGDTNGQRDIFVRDRDADTNGHFDDAGGVATIRVSNGLVGSESNGPSWQVSISATGRFVAFHSMASNLVIGDTNGAGDVFVVDRDTDVNGIFDEPGGTNNIRVSVSTSGVQGNLLSDQPSISADGRYVAFRSYANNLVSNDINDPADVFVRDVLAGQTTIISLGVGAVPADSESYTPAISGDGRFVTFASRATNLVAGDTNAFPDVFVFDRNLGVMERVSVDTAGVQANGESYHPSISFDGAFVAFISEATNLIALDLNGTYADVFLRKRTLSQTLLVSESFVNAQGNANSYTPAISGDGRYIVFASDANNLDLTADNNGKRDIFLHDRDTGLTQRVSLGILNTQANDMSAAPSISNNGRHVAFASRANNLVEGDTNKVWDVFAFDREGSKPLFLTIPANILGFPGSMVTVPVIFTSQGNSIETMAFSMDYDQNCLEFSDAIPGAVTFNLPGAFTSTYTFNASDKTGELDFAIYPPTNPVVIPDGVIANVTLNVKAACQAAPGTSRSARVAFSTNPKASFAARGQSIPGTTADGFVEVLPGLLGDCNSDLRVDSGDISAVVLEIFDNDGSVPANTPGGSFPGNPVGCNPNQDLVVDAGDVSCVINLAFGRTCSGSPTLLKSVGIPGISMPGLNTGTLGKVNLPVHFTPSGSAISTLIFTVNYDPTQLTFDPADRDGSGLSDAIAFNLPVGFSGEFSLVEPGKLSFVVYNLNQVALPESDLVTITLRKAFWSSVDVATVPFGNEPMVSFGTVYGKSLYGTAQGSEVELDPQLYFFLPVIQAVY